MSGEWILGIWTCLGIAWWMIAFILVATVKARPAGAQSADPRGITVFKPLPLSRNHQELARFANCIESFVADLDDNSELLIGCHLPDEERLQGFVQRMRGRYPDARIKLVVHENPNRYAHPKVSWLRILAQHASGELWFWSDADMLAPSGTIRSLRNDYAATKARMLTSPYVIHGIDRSMEMLEALYVNLELYPGVVLLDHLNLIRFAFGSGMLFEAEEFRRSVDWDFLGGCLAEDFQLGRLLAPTRLGSMRLSTIPEAQDWPGAILHYLRWQKTVRWCRPGSFAAQIIVLPVLGWLVWLLVNPTQLLTWLGLMSVLAVDAAAVLAICRILRCPIKGRHLPAIPLWSLARGLSWFICWIPWPVVWRGCKWWSPHYSGKPRAEVLDTRGQHRPT
jgi:ceramide glucosyltransferase